MQLSVLRYIPPLAALVVISACSYVDSGRWTEDIRLVNASGEVIYFTALELELSHRVDPLPAFDPESDHSFTRLDHGASIVVHDIPEYEPGDDVRFFIYALRQARGDEEPGTVVASLVEMLTISADELRRSRGHVVVEPL